MKLSVVIIAKNEKDMIGECLDSVAFAEEVVIVDNGSIDNTVPLAEKRKSSVIVKTKTEDFSKLRNLGMETARGEWILYVDSDERVSSMLRRGIERVINLPNGFISFKIKRKNFYLGNNEWPGYELLPRLFLKKSFIRWKGALHETPLVDGKIGILDGYLFHYSHRNLSTMLTKTIEWSKVEAELRLEAKHPPMVWWRFFRVMISAFLSSYVIQGGWKVGAIGLIESMYQSFSMFITYARLWEMQNKTSEK